MQNILNQLPDYLSVCMIKQTKFTQDKCFSNTKVSVLNVYCPLYHTEQFAVFIFLLKQNLIRERCLLEKT